MQTFAEYPFLNFKEKNIQQKFALYKNRPITKSDQPISFEKLDFVYNILSVFCRCNAHYFPE